MISMCQWTVGPYSRCTVVLCLFLCLLPTVCLADYCLTGYLTCIPLSRLPSVSSSSITPTAVFTALTRRCCHYNSHMTWHHTSLCLLHLASARVLPGISLLPGEVDVFAAELPLDFVGFAFKCDVILLFGVDSAQRLCEHDRRLCWDNRRNTDEDNSRRCVRGVLTIGR